MTAVDRFKKGQKSLAKLGELDTSRLEFQIKLFDRVIPLSCSYSAGRDGLEIQQNNSILVIENADSTFVYLTAKQIMQREDFLDLLRLAKNTTMYASDEGDQKNLINAINSRGAIFRGFTSDKKPAPVVEECFIIDQDLQRAYAKIGFNYFIHHCMRAGNEDFLDTIFTPIRDFILSGAHPGFAPVLPERVRPPIPYGESGHFVVQDIQRGIHPLTTGRSRIIVVLFLFDSVGWKIELTNQYKGSLPPGVSSHFWRLQDRTCYSAKVYSGHSQQ